MRTAVVPGGAAAAARRAEAGFTLLEVMLVLMVLGLALGLVASRGPPRSAALEIRGMALGVAQALRLARGRAIMLNAPVGVTLDLGRRTYRVDGAPEHALPPALGLSVLAVDGRTLGDRFAAISFAPDGSSSGGHVELSDGRRRMRVAVDWLSGRVSVTEAAVAEATGAR
jgi:general secretion pathway protein H